MSSPDAIKIEVESPLSPDMGDMITELNAVLGSLTPEEANYSMTADEMARPETTVFVARVDDKAAACGALYRHPDGIGEVKRFYVRPDYRRLGLARQILDQVIARAVEEGFVELVLETGHNYKAARQLYENAGFVECGPVLDYPESPYSVFYSRPTKAHQET